MAASRDTSDRRLDELYREHPEAFVAGRDQLVKDLRARGERDEAEELKKLRRPTVAAWLVNRVALTSKGKMSEFVDAGKRLEDAQRRALEGGDEEAAGWRDAVEREREATAALLEAVESAARDAGHAPSGRALELAGETLRAATGDPALRERVLNGRVEREQSAATLGSLAAAPPSRGERDSAKRREASQARRELTRLKEELAEATAREEQLSARVERATETLRQEKKRLSDSKRETAALRRQLKAADRT